MSLKIWGRRSAFNVQKVLWLAAELNLSYEHISAGGSFGLLDTAEFLTLNPHGRVPVLEDDETVIWESHTILRYLAAQYGQDQFWSQDAAIRSHADRWLDWVQTALQPAFLNDVFWGFYRTPETQRDWTVIQRGIDRTTELLSILDRQLQGKHYINGDHLSLADIAVGTVLYRYFNVGIEWPDLPNMTAYYQLLSERPSYQQHIQVDFSELYANLG